MASGSRRKGFPYCFLSSNPAPVFSNLPEAGPAWKMLRDTEYGPALNKVSNFGPDSKSGVPLEPLARPFAETRRPYQILGVPTPKGEQPYLNFGHSGLFRPATRPVGELRSSRSAESISCFEFRIYRFYRLSGEASLQSPQIGWIVGFHDPQDILESHFFHGFQNLPAFVHGFGKGQGLVQQVA